MIWWLGDRVRLKAEAHDAIASIDNDVFVSAVSVWEIIIKRATGDIQTPDSFAEAAEAAGLVELPLTWRHAEAASGLPALHKDPFDRMLVAQALEEKLVLLTRDPLVRQYPIATLAA